MRRLIAWTTAAVALVTADSISAQGFQLVEPSGFVTADVSIRRDSLIATEVNGRRYFFQRDRSFDSMNGNYAGYWLPSLNRIVRFPRSGHGRLQVADLDDAFPQFVFSRRILRPAPRGPRPGRPRPHRPRYDPIYGGWPYGGYGYRWHPYGWGYPSYGYINQGLTLNVFSSSIGYGSAGLSAPGYPGAFWPRPTSTIVDSKIVPRPALPPATVQLQNTSQRPIRVTIRDRIEPQKSRQVRIAGLQSQPVTIERDAGADRVQQIETYTPDGALTTRTVTIPIPPPPRYELVVHEWRLQSVAIDRTGKSPNVIEETNFQGRGLGRFELPPGDAVTSGTLDVVAAALSADNAGAVSPIIDQNQTPRTKPPSSLEQILLQQQKR
ncbi:hypothetical protein [Roseiconus lacunae]|uniref:hypothetical protein n=1 Tax=Roseiconus lacunae TaxID=2605694 RepID=UPI0011F3D292|nr:hypothetical protein [Roseiconus lacunae]